MTSSETDFRHALYANFVGADLMLRAAASAMEAVGRRRAIVNITSRTANFGVPGTAISHRWVVASTYSHDLWWKVTHGRAR